MARAGARVAIWARDPDKTVAALKELGALGAEEVGFACDVSREEDVARCPAESVDRLGPIHAGLANAGFATSRDALEMTRAEWRAVTAVNLDGTFVTLRDLERHMVAAGTAGKLVAVPSMVEHFGSPTQPHYAVYGNERCSDVVTRRTPLRRWGEPADLEGIAAYLASDEAAFHTGDSIRIDGGYSIF